MFRLVLALTVSLSSASAASDIKIAAWNIEHFAAGNEEGCRPRTESDYETLRKYVRQLNADVVAFQEVASAKAAARIFHPAEYSIEIAEQKIRAGYRCGRSNASARRTTPQLTGFAIRKNIRYNRNPDFHALDVSANNSLRTGVDITLRGVKPLRLLSVHLKASCPGQALTSNRRDCQTLLKQQSILEEQWIEERHRAKEAFAVLGDFNRHLLKPKDAFWAMTNDNDPPDLNLTSLSAHDEGKCSKRFPKRIDHILVDDKAKAMVDNTSFSVMRYMDGEDPSDHCPISALFKFN